MITHLFWLLPPIVIITAICSGRVNTTQAALLGLLTTIPVAIGYGPISYGTNQLMLSLARGMWIGVTITPYILGGLLFWKVAAHKPDLKDISPSLMSDAVRARGDEASLKSQRRIVFMACFLIGPFAESATGFGVGMLGTVVLIRGFNYAPRHVMVFALLSQTIIPWGAMSSGTLLAATYAKIPATQLGLYTVMPVAMLMPVWLALYWHTLKKAGLPTSLSECLHEVAWVAISLALLAVATLYVGPETALLAAYGPLIVVRYFTDFRPDQASVLAALRRVMPYVLLIFTLAMTRLLDGVKNILSTFFRIAPFLDLPAWSPLFHAGSWLFLGGVVTAVVRNQKHLVAIEAKAAWGTGKHAVLTVFLFAMMAEILSAAGISNAFALGLFNALGRFAILLTPLLSGGLGILTNSGNPSNSLFMPSQLALSLQAGLSVPAVAALQHASGMSMGIFSPVRMSMAASLAMGEGQERIVYASLLPYAAIGFVLLIFLALNIIAY